MTKEGLEKEVEEYLENEHCKNVCACDEVEECKKGIRIKCMSFYCKKELIVNFSELHSTKQYMLFILKEVCMLFVLNVWVNISTHLLKQVQKKWQ